MCCSNDKQNKKPYYKIQDIFDLHADDYIKNHKLNTVQKKFQWIKDRLKTTLDVPYYRDIFQELSTL